MSPLELTKGQVTTHWRTLQDALGKIGIPGAKKFVIEQTWISEFGFAALKSPESEVIERDRGGRVSAVPLYSSDPVYWLSWREDWEFAGNARYRFRESGLTVYEGAPGVLEKNQLFRAEWAGLATRPGGVVGWQAPGAAHPHWQFDALAELAAQNSREELSKKLVSELEADNDLVEEFGDGELVEVSPKTKGPAWTRMHFASAAKWNEIAWAGSISDTAAHAHSPTNSAEIQRWLIAAICYIKNELDRHHQ